MDSLFPTIPETTDLSRYIPSEGLNLVKYSGQQFVDKLRLEVIQRVVGDVLKGKNIRDLTEGLTQRRVLIVASSILSAYLKMLSSVENCEECLSEIIKSNVRLKMDPLKRSYLLWFLGLTGKSIQNVIRDSEFDEYVKTFDENLKDIARDVEAKFGDITMSVKYDDKELLLKWPNLVRCLLAVGASTLSIRGSEKSLYGKTFEHFVLASVLTILGFSPTSKDDTTHKEKVFWMNERKTKRESDAVLLVKQGVGVKFDIGFIGKGNTEISLDKVSRFERSMEVGKISYSVTTIILVDNIGDRSRIRTMARDINGYILQMRENYWVYNLARILKDCCGYDSPILSMTKEQSLAYIDENIMKVDLRRYIPSKEEKPKRKYTRKA